MYVAGYAAKGVVNSNRIVVVTAMLPGKSSPVAAFASVAVTVAEPLSPSLVAVIVADPAALRSDKRRAGNDATSRLSPSHYNTRPGSGAPLASRGVAASCPVCHTGRIRLAAVTLTV